MIRQDAKSIFLRAIESIAPSEWSSYLDDACGDDEGLRHGVEQLLAAHQEDVDLADQARALRDDALQTTDQRHPGFIGTQIGPYALREQIGEGGFGIVYLAEQERPVRRRVALKVIKPGMDSREVVARFEAERQALALMDHPNIAQVHDGGTTPDGRPFFVMELVKGIPITEYCDQCTLTTRERLDLFSSTCEAVQHAHQKGVIHRDLKPSNVLVAMHDGKPRVKVIDFGVAKATGQRLSEQTIATGFHQMIGTPLYMSPEQAEMSPLDVDTRTDIYALGVLLYELLTGTTPFEEQRLSKASYDELRRIIREEEPPRPSARLSTLAAEVATTVADRRRTDPRRLRQTVHGDLDWIAMKCLEKDRTRRYATASELVADIERYLTNEPVQASPPSTWYRLRKFTQRKRTEVVVASLVLLSLLILGAGVAWVTHDRAARQASMEGAVSLALREAERLQEHGKFPEALSAVKRAEGLLAGGNVREVLRERVQALRTDQEMVAKVEAIRLDRAAALEGLIDEQELDWRYERAFTEYGVDVESLSTEEAAARLRGLVPVIRTALLAALDDWAMVHRRVSKADGSRFRLLLQIARAADADKTRNRLRSCVEQRDRAGLLELATAAEASGLPAATLVMLADALADVGETQYAVALLRDAHLQHRGDFWINYRLAMHLHELEPPEWQEMVRFATVALAIRPQSSAVLSTLADAHRHAGAFEKSLACLHEALRLNPDYAWAHTLRGLVLEDQGKPDEAIAAIREAIRLKPDFAIAHVNLGNLLANQSQLAEAEDAYRESIRLKLNDAETHFKLGNVLTKLGKPVDAQAAYQEAIRLKPHYPEAHYNLGNVLRQQGTLADAEAAYRESMRLNPDYAEAHVNLGTVWEKQSKLDEAETAYREAIRLKPDLVEAHYNLGRLLESQRKLAEAETAYREAIRLKPDYAEAHVNFGTVREKQGKLDEAEAAYQEAIRNKPHFAEAHLNLGNVLRRQGKLTDAEAELREAIRLNPQYAEAHVNLGVIFDIHDKLTDAEAEFREAVRHKPDLFQAHHNLGDVLTKQNRLDEAITAYRIALLLDPDNACHHSQLANVLRQKGMLDEAIDEHRMAITLEPIHADHHSNFGLTLYQKNRFEEAIAQYQKAVEIDPDDADAYARLGFIFRSCGKTDEALAACREAVRLDPDAAWYHWNLAASLRDMGLLDEAIVEHRLAISLKPVDAARHFEFGVTLERKGLLEEAVDQYRKAIEVDPSFIGAHGQLGNALCQQGNLDEGIACYRTIIELNPNDALAYRNLGVALSRKGMLDEAIEAFGKSIEVNSNWRDHYDMGAAHARSGRWREAIAACRRALELDARDHWPWYNLAALLLYTGDVQAYLRTCQEMLERFGASDDPNIAERVAKTCLLVPDAVGDLALVQRLADRGVTGTEGRVDYPWFAMAKGMAEYRAGELTSAVDWLKRVSLNTGDQHRDATVSAMLAMAHHGLGHHQEAAAALAEAHAIVTAGMPDLTRGQALGSDWPEWVRCQIILREAEALLNAEDKEEQTH